MAGKKGFGKTFVLLIILLILIAGGLLIFNHLGIVHVNKLFSPVMKILKKDVQTSTTATQSNPLVANRDEERILKQRESLELFKEELDKREADIQASEQQYQQIAVELEEREKNLEEKEKTFNQNKERYDIKDKNIEQIAKNLNGMRPEAAVDILSALDDQTVIDVLRKVEEIAAEEGSSSLGSYWLSLMDPTRAAQIQRKMLSKPETLD
ncbi:MAG: flagellar protein FlbB [Spirochaetales bacterium]|nr:flagellar protein FlbB [Spirochaetales bacterium]